MVLRAGATPGGAAGAIKQAKRDAEQLSRQQGRGATALRNRSFAMYLDDNSSEPLLTPTGIDSGLLWRADGISVTSEDGTEGRDLTVRNLRVTGRLDVDGEIYGNGIRSTAGMSAVGDIATDQGVRLGASAAGTPLVYAPAIDASLGFYGGALYASNNANTERRPIYASSYPSERALKDETGTLDDALEVVQRWRPARFTWKQGTAYDDGAEHAAVYVDELADSAPELVAGTDQDGNRIPDPRGEIAYLTRAVQQLAEQNRRQAAEIDDLRAQISAAPAG